MRLVGIDEGFLTTPCTVSLGGYACRDSTDATLGSRNGTLDRAIIGDPLLRFWPSRYR